MFAKYNLHTLCEKNNDNDDHGENKIFLEVIEASTTVAYRIEN